MTRFRRLTLATGLVALTSLLAVPVIAQQPQGQQRQGVGGAGGRGPGGRGGFGGPGGFGGGLLALASNAAVQDDLKLDKDQKAALVKLSESVNKRMQEMRAQMGFGGRGNRPGGPGNAPPGGAPGGGAAGGQAGGGFAPGQGGGFAPGPGGVVPGPGGVAPGPGGAPGGRGNRPPLTPEQIQQFTAMREAMDAARQKGDQGLTQILDKGQFNRLKQIQLQLDGPRALVRPDMIEKLNMDEATVEMLQEIMNQERTASREVRNNRGQIFRMALQSVQGANTGGQQPVPGGQQPVPGGQAGGGQAGGRGGNARFNPELMKQAMEKPEIKSKMEQIDKLQNKIRDQFAASVLKVLSKRQRAIYAKMLGEPFDQSKLRGAPPWAARPGGPGATTKDAAKTTSKTTASDDEDEAPAAKPAAGADAPAKTPAAAKPKRKSLRESRGLGAKPQ